MKPALTIIGLVVIVALAYWFLVRPWHERWGATTAELALKMPGDEIAANADMISTRAVTVHAPAAKVYQWIVQLGKDRGGMYSYEWMENLIGCDIHNVYSVVPALQQVTVGQEIAMGPKGYPFYRIYGFETGKYLVLQPGNPATREPGQASWSFVVQEQPDGTTRLITRQSQKVDPGFGNFVIWRVFTEPISFVMEQKLMRTVRDLAEKS